MMPPPPPHELFAERPVLSEFSRRGLPYPVRRLITLTVMAAVIGGGGYLAYQHARPAAPAEIPTIAGDTNYKEKPENPGGIDIPHRDVEVYNGIDGRPDGDKGQVEHLLPPPEVPKIMPQASAVSAPVPAAQAGVENMLVPAKPAAEIETTIPPAPTPAPPPVAVAAKPLEPTLTPEAVKPSAPVVKAVAADHIASADTKTAKPPPGTAAVAPAAISRGHAAVQLASVQSEADSRQVMKRLQGRYASALGGAQLHVVRADLGARGIYYRIQSQPLPEAQAIHICSAVKSLNAGCILVRK